MSEVLSILLVAAAFAAFALLTRRAHAGGEPKSGSCAASRGCAACGEGAAPSTSECHHADR